VRLAVCQTVGRLGSAGLIVTAAAATPAAGAVVEVAAAADLLAGVALRLGRQLHGIVMHVPPRVHFASVASSGRQLQQKPARAGYMVLSASAELEPPTGHGTVIRAGLSLPPYGVAL
jgi:hypothetical protein